MIAGSFYPPSQARHHRAEVEPSHLVHLGHVPIGSTDGSTASSPGLNGRSLTSALAMLPRVSSCRRAALMVERVLNHIDQHLVNGAPTFQYAGS